MSATRADNGERQEWLVADQRGAFAMGTAAGARTRKYHGFYLGIAGRSETAYLVDFDLRLNGQALWPHRYESPTGPVVHPDPLEAATAFAFEPSKLGPRWRWDLPEGKLTFSVEAGAAGGIRLSWKWQGQGSAARKPALLEVRPFWAMRPLHGMGGEEWSLEVGSPIEGQSGRVCTVSSRSGQDACFLMQGDFAWKNDPLWYRQFHYTEEAERGYLAQEDLYSDGVFEIDLRKQPGGTASWIIADTRGALLSAAASAPAQAGQRNRARSPALDFVLKEPAGIVAGFPWFGEWGRDTFISLPGIAMAWIHSGGDPAEVWEWAQEILLHWGEWIRMTGMIPNLIETGGTHQWESSDGTLWWCHSLAALWTFAQGEPGLFPGLEERFGDLLGIAVQSIGGGRHRFLAPAEDGLLEVTEPHSTWMDAKLDGAAITPRSGKLPEINALWFQARCLQWIWSSTTANAEEIERLGRLALGCREPERPNQVFLHSVPLAPSFVLKDGATMAAHMEEITEQLWTPAGLRTLSPRHPGYRPRCVGDQTTRDQSYHQGPPWAWLGGHYEMARHRLVGTRKGIRAETEELRPGAGRLAGSVPGQVPELFDGEPPFTPRGTPAQAWSVACFEEAAARRRGRIDAKLTQILARRWLDRVDRSGAAKASTAPLENTT